MLTGTAFGQPLGYWFVHTCGDQPAFRLILGAVLMVFAVTGLLTPHVRRQLHYGFGVGAGLLGGFLGGAFVTGGPPVVMYLYSQADEPRDMKATIQFVFISSLLYRLVWVVVAGDWSLGVAKLALLAVPLAIPILIGAHWLSKYGSATRFRRVVYALIMLMGTGLLVKGLAMWRG